MSFDVLADENANRPLKWTHFVPGLKHFRPANLPIGSTAKDLVHSENKLKLFRYRPLSTTTHSNSGPILLIPSLINKNYILDLLPGYSFAEYLLKQGHDVFILDWGEPTDEDRFIDLETIVFRYLQRCLQFISETTQQKPNLIGYCIGGTLAWLLALEKANEIDRICFLTTPFDFHNESLLSEWSRFESFDVEKMVESTGNVPWYLMQSSFHALAPLSPIRKWQKLAEKSGDQEFLDRFYALETWGNDNVSFPGAAFLDLIKVLYRENSLMKEKFELAQHSLVTGSIDNPVMNVYSQTDHIVPLAATQALKKIYRGTEYTDLPSLGGHIGAIVGGRAQSETWPQISQWLSSSD